MNTKTMEGLVGARTNMDLLNTPFRVYKEARLRGDTATMERAMGYVNEFSDKADEYKAEADKGMKEDAQEAREKTELEREKALQKRREEREILEEKIEETRDQNEESDTVEVSEEGKALLQENAGTELDGSDNIAKAVTDKETVVYTKNGEVSRPGQSTNISVSVLTEAWNSKRGLRRGGF